MLIKKPESYDVSHWKEIPDFALVSPRPLLFITKASEAISFVDGKFVTFFEGMKQIGVVRGAFHFFRKAFDATQQAQHFINTIKPYVTAKDILILDVEEGGETAAQLKTWFEVVRAKYPNNIVLLYSRKNILDPILMFLKRLVSNVFGETADRLLFGGHPLNAIQMTTAQREYFKSIPTWVAGYPLNPDLYSSIPSFYIPDQARFGPAWLWQYSDKGQVAGIQGSVDLNLIDPVFLALIDGGVPPPPPNGGTMEDKYFQVTAASLNIRSSAESTPTNDLGNFNLLKNDVIHAIEVVITGSVSWHSMDKIWRGGAPLPFLVVSPTGTYWAAEKGAAVWMVETINPDPLPSPSELNVDVMAVGGKISGTVSGVDGFGVPFNHVL